jgi:hypothetical protein
VGPPIAKLVRASRPGYDRHDIFFRVRGVAVVGDVKQSVFKTAPLASYGVWQKEFGRSNLYDLFEDLTVCNVKSSKN